MKCFNFSDLPSITKTWQFDSCLSTADLQLFSFKEHTLAEKMSKPTDSNFHDMYTVYNTARPFYYADSA